MNELIIFGGTTEGRELAEFCAEKQIPAYVSVVSAYGKMLLPESRFVTPLVRPMGEADMEAFFRENGIRLIVDATHPYAVRVSQNIRDAAASCDIPVLRCLRQETPARPWAVYVENTEEAAEYLEKEITEARRQEKDIRPVLLTVGSHELEIFAGKPELRNLLYARILPGKEPLALAEKAGIPFDRLIAMQGPFSTGMNREILAMTKAAWIVMKDSGENGGTPEKLDAAASLGVHAIVIRRPKETGFPIFEVKKKLFQWHRGNPEEEEESLQNVIPSQDIIKEILLCGIGPGNPDLMTREVFQAIQESALLIGAKRMLMAADAVLYGSEKRPQMADAYLPDEIGTLIRWAREDKIAVLYSGDTGFYSEAERLRKLLQDQNPAAVIRILPGISSVSFFASKVGIPLEKAELLSVHGREIREEQLQAALGNPDKPWLIFLLGKPDDASKLCLRMAARGYGEKRAILAEKLSYPEENVRRGKIRDFADLRSDSLAILAVCAGEDAAEEEEAVSG